MHLFLSPLLHFEDITWLRYLGGCLDGQPEALVWAQTGRRDGNHPWRDREGASLTQNELLPGPRTPPLHIYNTRTRPHEEWSKNDLRLEGDQRRHKLQSKALFEYQRRP